MTSQGLQIFLGGFLATLFDIRIVGIALMAVGAIPKLWIGITVAAAIGATVLFQSQMKMAPILNIPDPDAAKFAMNFLYVGMVASIVALIKLGLQSLFSAKEV